ncbi:hypothetical protein StoSoilB20_07110 [Arthrobacter sp. StoSoilB20]|nr:hypothetical protein StoSoilB20_07110 [Arthrobacter sp. StoSoilB20]
MRLTGFLDATRISPVKSVFPARGDRAPPPNKAAPRRPGTRFFARTPMDAVTPVPHWPSMGAVPQWPALSEQMFRRPTRAAAAA